MANSATNEGNPWSRVERVFKTLVRSLDADELSDYLIQGQIISAEQLDEIKSQHSTKRGRCRELLLGLIRSKNPKAYKVFKDALEDNPQWHWIAETITGQQTQTVGNEQTFRMDEMKENIEQLKAERERLLLKLKDHELKDEEQKLKMKEIQKTVNQLEAEKELLGSRLEDYETLEKVKYADKPELVLTITTDDPLKKGQVIFGLAVLGNELFVTFWKSSEIEVYNSVTHRLERTLQIPNIKELYDLTAGKTDNCLFATILTIKKERRPINKEDPNDLRQKETEDAKDEESNRMIQKEVVAEDMQNQKEEYVMVKFDTKGNLLHPWSKPLGVKYGKLSTYEANLVACFNNSYIIKEFSRDGDLIREVPLPRSAGISYYWHAIKVTRMHYAVSYGYKADERHGICIVDLNGNIRMECRGLENESPASYNRPVHFIEGSDRSLLVADLCNYRILLLDWNLKFRRILIQLGNKQFSNRLCFDETQSKLFTSIHSGADDTGMVESAGVRVYNIKRVVKLEY